ncbi:hypothetical protein ACFY8B_33675 [Streptomyces sp. NPDC012751]|uniref:hypothetical protein n=1 Tax=Streptomyces sp. NPDC012751 TaxID=3364846 RepID=UPI0036CE7A34
MTRLGSPRRADDEVRPSQPALSETVRGLEPEPGVDLPERRRSGAPMSAAGRQPLPHIAGVLEGVGRPWAAAGERHRVSRTARVGTVDAATVPPLIAVLREFRATRPVTRVEVVGARQPDIRRGLTEGGFDLGLVPHLAGDVMPADMEGTEPLRGRPDFPVRGPAGRSAAITFRPLADETARVVPALQRRRADPAPRAVRDLRAVFARRAREPA